jgi:hypothetical protein
MGTLKKGNIALSKALRKDSSEKKRKRKKIPVTNNRIEK